MVFDESSPYYYDEAAVNKILRFYRKLLKHFDGRLRGLPAEPQPWMIDAISNIYGVKRKSNGKRRYSEVYIEIPRKNAKALHIDTPIPTPTGFKTVKDIQVGDIVYAGDGSPTKVITVTDIMQKPSYDVKFLDGNHMIACEGHLWELNVRQKTGCRKGPNNGEDRKRLIRDTKWISENLYDGIARKSYNCRISIEHKIDCPDAELPIPPYLLGLWLGDGTAICGEIASADPCVFDHIKPYGAMHRNKFQYQITHELDVKHKKSTYWYFNRQLIDNNLKENKHIPEAYLLASYNQRLELLQGLMDTDGTVSKKGEVSFCAKNERLAKDVYRLIRSLGIIATVKKNETWLYERNHGHHWNIFLRVDSSTPVFKLQRKLDRLRTNKKFDKTKILAITECIPVGIQPVKCIGVEHPSHTFLAGVGYIKTHNTWLIASIALYELIFGEYRGEVLIGAKSREQARTLFKMAKDFVLASPDISKLVTIYKNHLYCASSNSELKVVSRDGDTLQGTNPSVGIVDELHVQPDSRLYESMQQGQSLRNQPLMIGITTAGIVGSDNFSWKLHERAKSVIDGKSQDDTLYAKIYGVGIDDDWRLEDNWIKANPMIQVVPSKLDRLRELYAKALESKEAEFAFRRDALNQWLSSNSAWFADNDWMNCGNPELQLDNFSGQDCWVGLDLSSTTDLTSVSIVFRNNGKFAIFNKCFCPLDNIKKRSRKDKVPYESWVDLGYLIATEGNAVDYKSVLNYIYTLNNQFRVMDVAFDRWGASYLVQELQSNGINVKSFGQGFNSMSPASKTFERLLLRGELEHDNNPLLRWAFGNVTLELDASGNIKPSKKKSVERIDPAISTIMAVELAANTEDMVAGNISWT